MDPASYVTMADLKKQLDGRGNKGKKNKDKKNK